MFYLEKKIYLTRNHAQHQKKIKAFKDKKKETFIFIRELSPEQKIVPPGTPDSPSTILLLYRTHYQILQMWMHGAPYSQVFSQLLVTS